MTKSEQPISPDEAERATAEFNKLSEKEFEMVDALVTGINHLLKKGERCIYASSVLGDAGIDVDSRKPLPDKVTRETAERFINAGWKVRTIFDQHDGETWDFVSPAEAAKKNKKQK